MRVGVGLEVGPRHPRPVHPPVVGGVVGVVGPPVVVEQPDLVTRPDHRQAAEGQDDRVREQDARDGVRVARLEPGERGERAGDPPVPRLLVVLEDQPPRPRSGEGPGVEVGQEAPVRGRVEAHRAGVLVGDGPPDVVVAADVGDPGCRRRRLRQPLEGVRREAGVARGEHRPDLHHQPVVVGEVADPARVLTHAEVGRQLRRADDRLGLEQDRGGRDPGDRAERAGEVVHLGLVLAAGAEALPDERDRVQAEDLHAQVGQRQDDVGDSRRTAGFDQSRSHW